MLPLSCENIILDYYWSYRTYKAKQKLQSELITSLYFWEVHHFYSEIRKILYNVTWTN